MNSSAAGIAAPTAKELAPLRVERGKALRGSVQLHWSRKTRAKIVVSGRWISSLLCCGAISRRLCPGSTYGAMTGVRSKRVANSTIQTHITAQRIRCVRPATPNGRPRTPSNTMRKSIAKPVATA